MIILLINLYQFFGVSMVLFLAGLRGLPPTCREAALGILMFAIILLLSVVFLAFFNKRETEA